MLTDPKYEAAKATCDLTLGFGSLRPPRRVTVAEGAAATLRINQPGGYVGPWSAAETPYMVEPMNMLASRSHEAVCFVGPARTGKCLDVDTPIPTPSGWARMGDLKAGDMVFGPDGRPTEVLAAHAVKHNLPCYEVRFSDGTTLVADSEHLWGVERYYWSAPHWRYEVKSTQDLLRDLVYSERGDARARYRYRVRNAAPLATPDVELPLHPYLLGVWLGDGVSAQAAISAHKDDAAHYVEALEARGHTATVSDDGPNTVFIAVDKRARLTTHCQRGHDLAVVGRCPRGYCAECLRLGHWRRKHGADRHGNAIPEPSMFQHTFSARLRALGVLANKHIPPQYLRAGEGQRWALLRGLMDTDGTSAAGAGSAEFTSTKPALVKGFVELARSLGLKPAVKDKKTTWEYQGVRKTGHAFRVTFPIPKGAEVFTLPRKASRPTATADVGYRQIVAITPAPTRPVRCIQVDNESHLFLAGEGMVPTHNTMGLLDGWLSHCIVNDPGDFAVIQITQEKAREYSKTRIDRALRHSPALHAMKSASSQHDNTHDKMLKHGMWVRIAWPTVSNLSSSDYRYVALTDYDRMPDDIDGEGSAYALGLKRTTTFLSRGMCMVESSPGRDVADPNWRPVTGHEAPPTGGILGIYNRSDRRRWYWPCPDCKEYFEVAPGLGLFRLPPDQELLELVREADLTAMASQYNRIVCPHCGSKIGPKAKHELNSRGVWLRDGEKIAADGTRYGEPATSSIAGYWMGGAAAAYQQWRSLILRHLQGLREYALTGMEETLRATTNTDQGMPYLPRALAEASAGSSIEKQDATLERYVVPNETRFVVAAVDVQGGSNARFEVQVHAVGPHMEQWLVDRFAIRDSAREGVGTEFAPVDPAGYPEDWELLTRKVVGATYRTSTEGKEIQVLMTVVDTGGEGGRTQQGKGAAAEGTSGVTHNAYAWYRSVRAAGLGDRVMLVKGASTKNAPMVRMSLVGQRSSREKGDIPLFVLNTNLLKDAVHAGLRRDTPGPGYLHVPSWVNRAFLDELYRAETRNKDGVWQQVRKRNEAFDLAVYVRAACLRLGADKIKSWDKAPAWAQPLAANREVITREARREMKEELSELPPPEKPAPIIQRAAPARTRRVLRSNYLG